MKEQKKQVLDIILAAESEVLKVIETMQPSTDRVELERVARVVLFQISYKLGHRKIVESKQPIQSTPISTRPSENDPTKNPFKRTDNIVEEIRRKNAKQEHLTDANKAEITKQFADKQTTFQISESLWIDETSIKKFLGISDGKKKAVLADNSKKGIDD